MALAYEPLVNAKNRLNEQKIYARYIPTIDEVHLADVIVENGAHDVQYYDNEIQRLEQQLDHLRKNKLQIEQICSEYASLRAPIRRLPQELMIEIFLFIIEDTPIAIARSRSATRHPIFDLGLVCRAWRDSTMEMATSWATFSVQLDMFPSCPIPVLERLLARSKAAPLEFGLDVLRRPNIISVNDAPDILSALLRHSSRWKGADIRLVPCMIPPLLNCDNASNCPQLECLSLLPPPRSVFSCGLPLLILQNPLERLHSLHTISPFIPKEPQPWMAALQVLELCRLRDYGEAQRVLKLCPNIVFASLSFDHVQSHTLVNAGGMDAEERDMVELPELERLVISWTQPDLDPVSDPSARSLVRLSESITAPSLSSLEINSPHSYPAEVVLESIKTMLLRSPCELTILRLTTMTISENVVSLFRALRSLTHLHISAQLNSALCEALGFKPDDVSSSSTDVLLPSLQHLDVKFGHIGRRHLADRYPVLRQHLDLFHARRTPPPNSSARPLESVKFHYWVTSSDYTAFEERLRLLRETGLRVDTVDLT